MDDCLKHYVLVTRSPMNGMASFAGKLHSGEGPGQCIALKRAAKIFQTRAGQLDPVLLETLEVQQKFEQEKIAFQTTMNQKESRIKQLERDNLNLTNRVNDSG